MIVCVVIVILNLVIDQIVCLVYLQFGCVYCVGCFCDDVGGKGINVVVCLVDWGVLIIVLGVLGDGNDGVFCMLFCEWGIIDGCLCVLGCICINIKLVEEVNGEMIDINLFGFVVDVVDLDVVLCQFGVLFLFGLLVVLFGSLLYGLLVDVWVWLQVQVGMVGVCVLLDISGDVFVVVLDGVKDVLFYVIKFNCYELEVWIGMLLLDCSVLCVVGQVLVECGIVFVVIFMGIDGVLFIDYVGVLVV